MIKITQPVYGFTVGNKYPATLFADGYFAVGAQVSKLISFEYGEWVL